MSDFQTFEMHNYVSGSRQQILYSIFEFICGIIGSYDLILPDKFQIEITSVGLFKCNCPQISESQEARKKSNTNLVVIPKEDHLKEATIKNVNILGHQQKIHWYWKDPK